MASHKGKLLLLIALLLGWALIFGFRRPQESPPRASPPKAATPTARTAGPAQGGGLPRLKTELLQLSPPTYVPEVQSIFGTPPPPPAAAAVPGGPGGTAPPPPPPPDPFQEEAKRLRYLGFMRSDGAAMAFILQGQEVQTVELGATLAGRYRVQSVTEDAVVLSSPSGDKQVRLPLSAETASIPTR